MTSAILLSNGDLCFVDDDWHPMLSCVNWNICTNRWTSYAVHRERYGQGRRHIVAMHRLILDAGPGEVVDHINGNGLDNRRVNLRIVTTHENNLNRFKNTRGSSQFKGVTWAKERWQAQIKLHGQMYYLGRFESEIEAARAYDLAARKLFKEFAKLNFPHDAPLPVSRGLER